MAMTNTPLPVLVVWSLMYLSLSGCVSQPGDMRSVDRKIKESSMRDDVFIFGAIGVLSDYKNRPTPFDNAWQRFRLMQQSDGSHALLTSNGVNYVTAVQGGGLASGGITTDDLVTDRTQVQAWEKFRFVEHGSCTYVIQTATGHYLGKKTATTGIGLFATNITDINQATKFRLSMVF